MAGHAQLKFVMTECSKTQILLTRPISVWRTSDSIQSTCTIFMLILDEKYVHGKSYAIKGLFQASEYQNKQFKPKHPTQRGPLDIRCPHCWLYKYSSLSNNSIQLSMIMIRNGPKLVTEGSFERLRVLDSSKLDINGHVRTSPDLP